MIELLDRREIPIQPVVERHQDMDAVVPVHLGIIALATEVKESGLDVMAARRTVIEWYDEDMGTYIEYLHAQGYKLSQLRGYEAFNKDWVLDAESSGSGTGFLNLTWREDTQIHTLHHDAIPVPFQNIRDENGYYYVPDVWDQKGIFPIVYRSIIDPVILFMQPEKMKHYGVERPELNGIIIDPVGGIAEVLGTSFNSTEYLDSLAKALVLRNFGVAYLNQLAPNVDVGK